MSYVEYNGEPGRGTDRAWIQVSDKSGVVIPVSSMASPANANPATLEGGNVQVPH